MRKFEVDHTDAFPTHQPLKLVIDIGSLERTCYKYRKTSSAANMLEDKIQREIQQEADMPEEDRRTEAVIRKANKQALKQAIAEQVEARKYRMQEADTQMDTTRHWQLQTEAVEAAFSAYFGHGKVATRHEEGERG